MLSGAVIVLIRENVLITSPFSGPFCLRIYQIFPVIFYKCYNDVMIITKKSKQTWASQEKVDRFPNHETKVKKQKL